ncbi:MAG: YncE family protein [Gemmatimonas sp.]
MHTILLPVTATGKPTRRPNARVVARAVAVMTMLATYTGAVPAFAQGAVTAAPASAPAAKPTHDYWVYVGAESADKLYRVRFGPAGTVVEKTIVVGELAAEMEGPHGLAISRDGKYLYMTTGHGTPDGKLWRYVLGPDTLAGPGVLLGNFPASLDVTPDGLYSFSANFNLHGDMIPSTVSVVYTPNQTEVARIVTCTMPHGSRISPDGLRQYSTCMMDDQLVEIDTRDFVVARRFGLAKGKEGPLAKDAGSTMAGMAGMKHDMAGMTHDMTAAGGAKPVKPVTATVDPAQVGRAGMGIEKHTMAPASCSPTWAQPSVTGDRIWVACNKSDEILEINNRSWTLTRRLKTGRGVYNLAVTPDGKLLVATLKPGSSIEIFDIATGKSLAQIKTSNTLAHGITVSSDSKYAFVSSEGVGAAPGKVDVFDLTALTKVGTADVGQQASGIAFWRMN